MPFSRPSSYIGASRGEVKMRSAKAVLVGPPRGKAFLNVCAKLSTASVGKMIAWRLSDPRPEATLATLGRHSCSARGAWSATTERRFRPRLHRDSTRGLPRSANHRFLQTENLGAIPTRGYAPSVVTKFYKRDERAVLSFIREGRTGAAELRHYRGANENSSSRNSCWS